jgi:hypothetical protein
MTPDALGASDVYYFLAYIDPGAGSLFVQAVIGGILAALYAIKLYWFRLKAGMRRLLARRKGPPQK